MVELVDTQDSGSCEAIHVSSSLISCTIEEYSWACVQLFFIKKEYDLVLINQIILDRVKKKIMKREKIEKNCDDCMEIWTHVL